MSEARLEALLHELEGKPWDVVVLSETWRESARETLRLDSEHLFYGSGGDKGRSGVGFLVHKQHAVRKFQSVNDRLAFIDIKLGLQTVRIFGVYFPHSGCNEEDVEVVYEMLAENLNDARRRIYLNIIGGDFNAQAGRRQDHDAPHWESLASDKESPEESCYCSGVPLTN